MNRNGMLFFSKRIESSRYPKTRANNINAESDDPWGFTIGNYVIDRGKAMSNRRYKNKAFTNYKVGFGESGRAKK